MSCAPAVLRLLAAPASSLRALVARHPDRYPVLFDSASRGPLARWSFVAALPEGALWMDATGRVAGEGVAVPVAGGFLDTLDRWWRHEARSAAKIDRAASGVDELPPFGGGFAVFLGYEMAQEVEPTLRLPASPEPWRALALRTRVVLAFDHLTDRLWIVHEPGAARLAHEIEADLATLPSGPELGSDGEEDARGAVMMLEEDPARYVDAATVALARIGAGDIYQANLSRAWRGTGFGSGAAHGLYERLRERNPGPFAAWLRWRGFDVLSSSPERLLRIDPDRRVSTRPIAGTRPRAPGRDGDAALKAELIASDKERAEHVMLIDLERNDLGRVCLAGSVRVDEWMAIETYAHVHHIVSNVTGQLRADRTPVDALRAVFPGGTITGCPKVRCMQLIAELEGTGRGAYTGSLGWLGLDGAADFNILIRTLTLHAGQLSARAGAGIVADSVPQRELEETRAKARGLLAALESAG